MRRWLACAASVAALSGAASAQVLSCTPPQKPMTVYETIGQWRDPARKVVVREKSRVLRIIIAADEPASGKIAAVADAYKKQFSQKSVGIVTRPACVSF
jgi:hypothetical protein